LIFLKIWVPPHQERGLVTSWINSSGSRENPETRHRRPPPEQPTTVTTTRPSQSQKQRTLPTTTTQTLPSLMQKTATNSTSDLQTTQIFLIPNEIGVHIFGRQGKTIKEIKKYHNVQITTKVDEEQNTTLIIQGARKNIENTIDDINQRILEQLAKQSKESERSQKYSQEVCKYFLEDNCVYREKYWRQHPQQKNYDQSHVRREKSKTPTSRHQRSRRDREPTEYEIRQRKDSSRERPRTRKRELSYDAKDRYGSERKRNERYHQRGSNTERRMHIEHRDTKEWNYRHYDNRRH
jgi:hypothetical protein